MNNVKSIGFRLLSWTQDIGLVVISIFTIIAIGMEIKLIIDARTVTLADLLLLFIYLEVLAMVSIYLESGKLPVRFPLYIAIVALARYLILDMKNLDTERMLAVSGAALLISMAVLVVRFGHSRYPYKERDGE